MKNIFTFLSILMSFVGFSQEPQLFYHDGGDLGPLEIRSNHIYYLEHQLGLKELPITNPIASNLIVDTEEIFNIEHIFWGLDGTQVYFGNVINWYKSPFIPNEVSEAAFLRDFSGQYLFDIKEYENEYYLAFADVGTFFFSAEDVDPLSGGQGIGFSNSFARNISIENDIFYYTGNQQDTFLYRLDVEDTNETPEVLFEFDDSVTQLEISDGFLYAVLKEMNTIVIFQSQDQAPWEPQRIITLDSSVYSLENIVINEGDIYFTDSNQGNIYIITEETLSLEALSFTEAFLFPNPAGNAINLAGNGISIFNIFDTTGKLVGSYTADALNQSIDLRFLVKGIYFGQIILETQEIKTVKFIKN